jgi:hypothetical protein
MPGAGRALDPRFEGEEAVTGRTIRQGVVLATLLMLCLAACSGEATRGSCNSPARSRAGEWKGVTEFGSFAFQVCPGGWKITYYSLEYQIDGAAAPQRLEGRREIAIASDGSFDLSAPEAGVVFQGQFSEDDTRASGRWEIRLPDGGAVSATWAVER